MWLPTVFAATNDYEQISTGPAAICDVLEYSANRGDVIKDSNNDCTVVSMFLASNSLIRKKLFISHLHNTLAYSVKYIHRKLL